MAGDARATVATEVVPLDRLRDFTREAVSLMGFADDDADIFTDVLVTGSLRTLPGQGQGVQQLPVYWERVQAGIIRPEAEVAIVNSDGAVALLDANRASGAIAGTRGMRAAIERASAQGIGAVGVRNSTHFGVAAYYAMLALPHEYIGIVFSNAGPEIAPWGGTRATVGTNPWAIAVPTAGDRPLVLDLANSTSGKGMISWYLREGRKIPIDWALRADGRTTEDPAEGMEGTLFPLGGAKGYAMAVMVDALTGVLTGSAFGLSCFMGDHHDVGHLLLAIDIARFRPLGDFYADLAALVGEIRSSPLAVGAEAIFLPGELEAQRELERRAAGVPLERSRFDLLCDLGRELGVTTALEVRVT
jgi:LDH2 family malate/lactate/ureidoglycolate dehydrogenase